MTIEQYVDTINKRYKQGNTTEHSFRGDLLHLLETLIPDARITNEPKRQTCGAPDYIVTKRDIPLGFIEAKDIGDADLDGIKKTGNKEQFDRYKASLNNIIFTDYLSFHLYHEGLFVTKIAIAELHSGAIIPLSNNFTAFTNLIKDFTTKVGQTIKSSKRLAEMMAAKARLLADVIEKALSSDVHNQENSTLADQMAAFKEILIHDITPKSFADVYAQTIAYGLFAARLHDPTLPTFSRAEAAELIPKSNPFLRKLFGYIAGPDIDDRIKWIVDSLIEVFLACNVEELLKNYGRSTKTEDPIIHFYETFLSEYDPKLRKARGVWYTPHPVVNFIVRAVDDILKTEFGLKDGLADTSKTKIKVQLQETDKRYKDNIKTVEEEVHRVQILDPATGTGTFLAEVVKQVHEKYKSMQGAWSSYVDTHLLPRLNGFELLMASYAMAHLQLDLLLTETGYKSTKDQRFRVYLTNSLEEYHKDTGTLFANWLSTEANEANRIKRDTPVMCVIGNPPYSGESENQGEWIMKLMDDYKKEPGGKDKLNERNTKWINADENKFIRYGQHFIEKNGTGVLGYINPHSFLDSPTLRGMRWHLLKTFDKIYIVNLQGNAKRGLDINGTADENVFDIMQGVSINIFIKTGQKKNNELAKVFYHDVFGKRELKYDFLVNSSLQSISFSNLSLKEPMYYMVEKDFDIQNEYDHGFAINQLFDVSGTGMVSKRDEIAYQFSRENIKKIVTDIYELSTSDIKTKYNNINWESRDGKVEFCKNNVMEFGIKESLFVEASYRPFDSKWTYYTGKSKGFVGWPVDQVMKNLLNRDNVAIDLCRQLISDNYSHIFITNKIVDDSYVSNKSRERGYVFPLYIYQKNNIQQSIEQTPTRTPNLNTNIVEKIAKSINHVFLPDENLVCDLPAGFDGHLSPLNILDYIYAVLHSPTYREKYKEFLKIDFPRVPYPKNAETFWKLVKLGGELRQIHLLESPVVSKYITKYPVDGDNRVGKIRFEPYDYIQSPGPPYPDYFGAVYINDTQYFDGVPEVAWTFYIGGYQPAQKWLKDRKDRQLSFEDILHYQKIIVALTETDRIMKKIDAVEIE